MILWYDEEWWFEWLLILALILSPLALIIKIMKGGRIGIKSSGEKTHGR